MLIITFLVISSLNQLINTTDCVYTPDMWKQNCAQFCLSKFADGPQRGYYNITSQNCQPIVSCDDYTSYYDYSTNTCYVSDTNRTLAPSSLKWSLSRTITIQKGNSDMLCIQGNYVSNSLQINGFCQCNLLWVDSGLIDINGVPFKCDIVTNNAKKYFVGSLVADQKGNILYYGKFTALEMQVMLNNSKIVQQQLTMSYVYSQTDPILYAINSTLQNQKIFNQIEYKYFLLLSIVIYVIFALTYANAQANKVQMRKKQFQQKITLICQNNEKKILKLSKQ